MALFTADGFRKMTGSLSEKLESFLTAIDGSNVDTVANVNVVGGVPVLYRAAIADASGDTSVVVTHKIRVLRYWIHNKGIAAHATDDHVQLFNGSDAISNEVAKTATQYAIKEASTLDPDHIEIAAGGTMKFTAVKDTNVACDAYVLAVKVE